MQQTVMVEEKGRGGGGGGEGAKKENGMKHRWYAVKENKIMNEIK